MSNGWTAVSPCAPPTLYLPLNGGTMTGPLILAADPVQNLEAATKQYVDEAPVGRLGDNRLINGNFSVNQRAYVTSTALAADAYGHDRWKAGAAGCTYTFTAALPDTTITITAGTLTQIIEAGMIEGGVYTLSWTGTAHARVYQGSPTGSYAASPLTTTLPVGVNTAVEFNAGTVTCAKLETGSVATPFNRQSLAKGIDDCQRYFLLNSNCVVASYGTAGQTLYANVYYPTRMRANPTLTLSNINPVNATGLAATALGPHSATFSMSVIATGQATVGFWAALSAEL